MIIGKRTMLSFSGGEWSDKWTYGPFEVLRDFDQKEVAELYVSGFEKVDEWDRPDESRFWEFLVRNEYIADVDKAFNWYIGAYGEFEPSIVEERNLA